MSQALRFTKLYKFLFEDPTFNTLPAKAKLLYALISERQSLSKANAKQHGIQSQFIDNEGRLFSIYTNQELMTKLNMSEPTVIKLKKQLIEFGLLEDVRLGNNQSNRLYPKKPYDNYFYTYDVDEFYRLPHALFENPKYQSLAAESIIAYAIYLSRYEYSVYKNHFIDKNNNVYCVMTNEELALRLSCERKKVSRIKNELIACGLLMNEKSSIGKANRIYINLPEASDIKELKKWDVGNLKNGTYGTKKMGRRELKKWDTSYTYSSYTYLSDIDSSDMNDMYDNNIDEVHDIDAIPQTHHSSHTNHQYNTEDSFNDHQVEQDMLLQNLPDHVKLSLKHFSNAEIRCIKSVLNKAKANYNHHAPVNERVTYEDCAYNIGEALRRIKLLSRQKNENICQLEAYMMQTFKRVFVEHVLNDQQHVADIKDEGHHISQFEPKNEFQAMAKRMFLDV
ncbi:replication initiator protein A (plasmid) [Staphylococcus aureus]|uniref:replication initiator protein A n=1 Tax=Staphylococcus aureus TaxID=1280 RepID=UPI0021D2ED1C|nr:replication initiator protein A [Staphylococcus aureus]UXT11137.1 replication initiator protein A [Staphylococcus aureus]UXT19162.1 replication initiator protein A [Staphylococcus aureus]UXU11618.1 replication initiator protein A [Staphylococcus aureus]UXU35518.1 replication initiator protein A [Staphylococcus aureus]UXU40712.1 replication initiator protein A [Staphylococcus aureus]